MQRTPLFEEHLALGAKMVDFAGWEMPINYPSGISQEHIAVRTNVGLFDVSHMGEIRVRGPEATAFLSFVTLNDPAKLKPGHGQYSMLPNNYGGLTDDLYIYCDAENDFLVVCNASNRNQVVKHLETLVSTYDAESFDESDNWALLALQGPGSSLLLSLHLGDQLLEQKKNSKRVTRLQGALVDIARTGYTGEDGFEIFCRPDDARKLWRSFLAEGAEPCGLGARDTLRLEAGFPLFGHEFTDKTNPLCTDFAWVVKDKPFYGREAMWGKNCNKQLVGLRLLERGIPRQGYGLYKGQHLIGEVSSGTISPLTRESVALGWINKEDAILGADIAVEIRGQHVLATIVKPPFYQS
ncbi:MAG: glycine cleavage system aminomethyltransferase GcvT [Trueperaceae bacterium]